MNDQNRVLTRRGARELTEEETLKASGGLPTDTVCTLSATSARDGDTFLGEC